ncbi:hypothetical protein AB0I84_50445, partial [Streptomyces spectabilis]|uniref:hypothetical protein n=1 Tax=Streptomyces spectabilis TaxID=68270 RepID=UPI0033C73C45
LPVCRLTVASACQSGHYGIIETPDEFLGLPAWRKAAGTTCAAMVSRSRTPNTSDAKQPG